MEFLTYIYLLLTMSVAFLNVCLSYHQSLKLNLIYCICYQKLIKVESKNTDLILMTISPLSFRKPIKKRRGLKNLLHFGNVKKPHKYVYVCMYMQCEIHK